MIVRSESDDPGRFAVGSTLLLADGSPLVVVYSKSTERGLLVRFEGVRDRTGSEAMAGRELFVHESERRRLDDDEYWPDQLIGLEVRSGSGEDPLGRVVDYVEGVAQDRLGVETSHGRVEIPFVKALVPLVDLERGVLVVTDLEGLLDEE